MKKAILKTVIIGLAFARIAGAGELSESCPTMSLALTSGAESPSSRLMSSSGGSECTCLRTSCSRCRTSQTPT